MALDTQESEFLESILISKARITDQDDIVQTVEVIKVKAKEGKFEELREYFGDGKVQNCFKFTKAEIENIVNALKWKNDIANSLIFIPLKVKSGTESATPIAGTSISDKQSYAHGSNEKSSHPLSKVQILCPTRFETPSTRSSLI